MAEGRFLKDEVFPSQQLLLLWDATENREKWRLIHSPACRLLILPWLGLPLQQTSDHWDPQLEASRICQSVRNWRNSHLDSWIETTETAQIRVSSFRAAAKGAAEGKTRTLHNEGPHPQRGWWRRNRTPRKHQAWESQSALVGRDLTDPIPAIRRQSSQPQVQAARCCTGTQPSTAGRSVCNYSDFI